MPRKSECIGCLSGSRNNRFVESLLLWCSRSMTQDTKWNQLHVCFIIWLTACRSSLPLFDGNTLHLFIRVQLIALASLHYNSFRSALSHRLWWVRYLVWSETCYRMIIYYPTSVWGGAKGIRAPAYSSNVQQSWFCCSTLVVVAATRSNMVETQQRYSCWLFTMRK